MTQQPRVLAIIPARGGSKGVPRKNILMAGGKPLIAWTIEAAQRAQCVTRLIVSSDDDAIIQVAQQHGCDVPFKRPAELATDEASSVDVVLHALQHCPGFDHVLLLQPTSPLRSAADIEGAFALLRERQATSCVSVCPVEETPYWMYHVDSAGGMKRVLEPPEHAHRRQDLPTVCMLNGAVYVSSVPAFMTHRSFVTPETLAYVMPRERSFDIDTREDFDAVARRLAHAHEQAPG